MLISIYTLLLRENMIIVRTVVNESQKESEHWKGIVTHNGADEMMWPNWANQQSTTHGSGKNHKNQFLAPGIWKYVNNSAAVIRSVPKFNSVF